MARITKKREVKEKAAPAVKPVKEVKVKPIKETKTAVPASERLKPSKKEMLKAELLVKLESERMVSVEEASVRDMYFALANLTKDRVAREWIKSKRVYKEKNVKQVYYFSLEFLMGKTLRKDLSRLGLISDMTKIVTELGFNMDEVLHVEPDAGLGNGGLGRLAACFLDSLAACSYAGHGNGIRYQHGLFKQKIVNGYQVEEADNWLSMEHVFEIRRSQDSVEVKFYGEVEEGEKDGNMTFSLKGYDPVLAVPYDVPMVGYDNGVVNTLRLWSAEPVDGGFDFSKFSRGEYTSAVEYRQAVRAISDVLYPDDSNHSNKLLRLKQQYFFVSAGMQSIVKSYLKNGNRIEDFAKYTAIHINDTHPALCVPELMRILVDEFSLGWDQAWEITQNTLSYTNHTIMPEALEKWSVDMYKKLLPRIYQITQEINRRLCNSLYEIYPDDVGKVSYMAIIQGNVVNMANLSIVGSHSVNGVAAVHSKILVDELFHDYYMTYPERFNNKTNGITHRRWLVDSNPALTSLITSKIGRDFIKKPLQLSKIIDLGLHKDKEFLEEIAEIKRDNKVLLSNYLSGKSGVVLDPDTLFDVQVKRIHTYKRQLLKALHILEMYFDIKDNPKKIIQPMTFLFGGKAAPGFVFAKLTIKFINSIANLVNNDPETKGLLTVLFMENYDVSLAQRIFPASDLSEQISTASKEASGTGNMKFMMNGAVTVGTMDGANIEIAEAVGDENIFTFGLSVSEVLNRYREGNYNSFDIYNSNYKLRRILDTMRGNFFKDSKHDEFMPIFDSLTRDNDEYFVLEDFDSYIEAMNKVMDTYRSDQQKWLSMAAVNIAKSGRFSSDETIKQYADEIWNLKENKIRP